VVDGHIVLRGNLLSLRALRDQKWPWALLRTTDLQTMGPFFLPVETVLSLLQRQQEVFVDSCASLLPVTGFRVPRFWRR
jgi:hypothetical protein